MVKNIKYYSQDDVACLLGVSVNTVRWWRSQGELAYAKVGRHVRISDLDLEDFLARNTVAAKAGRAQNRKEGQAE